MISLQLNAQFNIGEQEYSICEFCDHDLDAIFELELKANQFPWSRKNFQDSIQSTHICVGIKTQELWVAHAVFSLAAGEAELLIVAVAPEYQSRGLAKKLLQHMESVLQSQADQMFLEVRASNQRAIDFYESYGFNELGVRANYYPTNKKGVREDAYMYGKSLLGD